MDQALVNKAVEELKGAVGKLVGIHGGIGGIIRAVPEVVAHVEAAGEAAGLSGPDKKEFAMAVLFALVPLPWWAPRWLVEPILSHVIDATVSAVKTKIG